MNVAFYAPLKPPDHPTPSGDRTMARMLIRALTAGGHRVDVASRLRSFEPAGDARAQARIRRRGERRAAALIERYRAAPAAVRPQLWFTYHLYHKAPDWLGPAVARALGIGYVVAEASHAPKQAGGPWDEGYRAAARAMRSAARIVTLNPVDEPCVRALLGGDARLARLAPFIDARASARRAGDARVGERLRAAAGVPGGAPVLVTVAMMRAGAKLASYRVLAEALSRLTSRRWSLLVLGDGPARERVVDAFAPMHGRVVFAGRVAARELPAWLAGCDLHLWPAIGEAWGMAFLEAGAAGLASIGGDAGGVAAVVAHGRSGLLAAQGDAGAFADAVAALLDDPGRRARMAGEARRKVLAEHDLAGAARTLDAIVRDAVAA